MIPIGSIIPFDGSNSNIPANWERDNRFNEKFPRGYLTDFGTTGGSNSHSHLGINHTHSFNSHTHTSNNTTSGPSSNGADNTDTNTYTSGDHTHSISLSAATFSGNNLSDTIDYPAESGNSLPAYYQMIFIRSLKKNNIPLNGCVWNTSTSRKNMVLHNASAGRFLMGSSEENDAGTIGGSNIHSHNLSHTHTSVTHNHSGTTGSAGGCRRGGNGGGGASTSHNHTYSISQSLTGDSYSGSSAIASTLPQNTSVNLYIANTKATKLVAGDIIMIIGEVPKNWLTCDGQNNTPNLNNGLYIKNNETAGETVTDLNSNHNHGSSNSHSHSQSHNHDGSATTSQQGGSRDNYGGTNNVSLYHTHTISNISTSTMSWNETTMSAEDNFCEPPFIKVQFIMATKKATNNSASLLLNLL